MSRTRRIPMMTKTLTCPFFFMMEKCLLTVYKDNDAFIFYLFSSSLQSQINPKGE